MEYEGRRLSTFFDYHSEQERKKQFLLSVFNFELNRFESFTTPPLCLQRAEKRKTE
jgi:hypothetical protein